MIAGVGVPGNHNLTEGIFVLINPMCMFFVLTPKPE